ncbi:MAG: U32 family peptidase [Alistipes sp.]|nr:U32 family peptidase [Alistipes sp.]
MKQRKIELLAPARDLATGRVAIDAGADAVYIGGPGFGARRAAGNAPADVAELVRHACPFGVRVYATLNTLLFDDELDEARRVARELIDAGVDALIVQDMAYTRLGVGTPTADFATQNGVELHASTQMTNILPEDVSFLGRAGFRRVILERGLSIDEIRAIRAAAPHETELEVFVHGAICVGHSGRCFMSRAMDSSRSGNRGDCAQPCRLTWDLMDSGGRAIIQGKHLLSVRDMDLGARLGELLDAGVTSFKIEGRLKDATYARNVVSHYRRLLDDAIAAHRGLRRASVGVSLPDFTPDPVKSFSRGSTGWFFDGPARGVASFDTPKAMGEVIGSVAKTGCDRTGNRWFTLTAGGTAVSAGDGICWLAHGELKGTNINRVEADRIYPNHADGLAPGTAIFRNYDHAFVRSLERSRMRRRIGVTARVLADTERIEITFTDETGLAVSVVREGSFEVARDAAAMAGTMRRELSRSGDTIFEMREVRTPSGEAFIPVSTIAAMRREGLETLLETRRTLLPERNPATEDPTARAPRTRLEATDNVTNRLAESFWRDHGVEEIAPAMELRRPAPGDPLMQTRYCLRREIGECLREGSKLRSDLFMVHGTARWRLDFDCEKCYMTVTKT